MLLENELNLAPFFQGIVLPAEDNWQVKTVLKKHYCFSTGLMRQVKSHGFLLVNKKQVPFTFFIKAWDRIEIFLSQESKVEPENLPLEIRYEDNEVLVVNKPAGQVVHPRHQYVTGTLANGIAGYLKRQKGQPSSYLINRLDKGTSGLLLAAKNPLAAVILSQEIPQINREYLALVSGVFKANEGTIRLPIHTSQDSIKRVIAREGKASVTKYTVIRRFINCTLLRLSLESGRTHQIRVHLSAIGHPVLGDFLYGKPVDPLKRPLLHASFLSFSHPKTGARCKVEAPLPDDFQNYLKIMSKPN